MLCALFCLQTMINELVSSRFKFVCKQDAQVDTELVLQVKAANRQDIVRWSLNTPSVNAYFFLLSCKLGESELLHISLQMGR